MKRTYSIILLVTFLVGTLQPILPMIEYQLFEGDLLELLGSNSCFSENACPMIHCFVDQDCPDCEDNNDQTLLDTDYYPLALEITTIPDPQVFPKTNRFYLPVIRNVISPIFFTNPPPPRLS